MAITTIRPTGQLGLAAVSASGAASAVIATSDNSDSSYIIGTGKDAYALLAFGDISLTATQRVKSCQVNVRDAKDSAGFTTQNTLVQLLDSTQASSSPVCKWTVQRTTTSIATGLGPLSYIGPDGQTWSQTLVNNLAMYIQWYLDSAQLANFMRLHELYIDVDINEQPVVTGAPVVTGFATTTRPTVSWVYSDLDGDPQSTYRVKIFDAATVATGNFDPETSTPTADSGDVDDVSARSWTPTPRWVAGVPNPKWFTGDLAPGGSYTAYVKVGQSWPGPQGSVWWSNWAASAPFTITVVPPSIPTLTVALVNDGQQYRTLCTITTPLNLLYGDASSFETGLGGWTADANCTPTWITTDHAEGVGCMQLSSTASGDMRAKSGFDLAGDPQVDAGTTYTALASFKAAVSARTVAVGIRWRDKTGAAIGADVFGTGTADNTSTWTARSCTAVAPANATQAWVIGKVTATGGAAEIHKMDMADLHVGSGTTWTPGYYLRQGVVLERGDRIDSQFGAADNWAHPQVATAGAVIRNQGQGFSASDSLVFDQLDRVIPNGGSAGLLHWILRTASASTFKVGTWYYYPDTPWNFPVAPAQAHVFSGWAWCQSGTFTSTLKIEWLNPDGSPNSTSVGPTLTLTTTAQQVSMSATCPAGAVGARAVFVNDASSNTADVFFTRFGWGLGTVPVDYKEPRGGDIVWTPVRFDQSPALVNFPPGYLSGQTTLISDWEVPPGRPVLYRTRLVTTDNSGNPVSSPYAYAPLYAAPPTRAILKSVSTPTVSVAVNRQQISALFGRHSQQYVVEEDAQVFHPLGRDGSPVRIRDWIGGRDGTLILLTTNDNQVATLYPLMMDPGVLLVQWAQGGQSYLIVTKRDVAEEVHYMSWCDTDGGLLTPSNYLRYAQHTWAYIETTRPS